jgi:hypothetical protein
MLTISVPEIFNISSSSSDFPYLPVNSRFTFANGDYVKTILTPENVNEKSLNIFHKFLEAIDIDNQSISNFGFAGYYKDVPRGNCPVYMGTRDGVLGILIGASLDGTDYTDKFIPVTTSTELVQKGRKQNEELVYRVNGAPIKLKEREKDGVGTGRYYIAVDYADDDGSEYVFTFPFLLIKKDVPYNSNEILANWKSGNFSSVVRSLDEKNSSTRIWIEANKAFINNFKDMNFPQDGVLILAKNGKFKTIEAGSHPAITSTFSKTEWEIITTSHPELLIQYRIKGKEFDLCSLGDATNISFSSAKMSNEGYSWLCNLEETTWNNVVLIHIVEHNRVNIEHIPVNTLTALPNRIKMKISSYPHMVEAYRPFDPNKVVMPALSMSSSLITTLPAEKTEAPEWKDMPF